jgi:hypothetical protein
MEEQLMHLIKLVNIQSEKINYLEKRIAVLEKPSPEKIVPLFNRLKKKHLRTRLSKKIKFHAVLSNPDITNVKQDK